MKINWGTGIVVAFVLFIAFILFFVVTATTNSDYDFSLVSEKYYENELTFQEEINKYQNTKKLGVILKFSRTDEGVLVQFPKNFKVDNNQIKISLYRPSNQRLDSEFSPIFSSVSTLLIPSKMLLDGRWDIKLSWKQKDKEYLYKKEFIY